MSDLMYPRCGAAFEPWGLGTYTAEYADGPCEQYGFAVQGTDPFTFTPDPECATLPEVTAWWFACQAAIRARFDWARGEGER